LHISDVEWSLPSINSDGLDKETVEYLENRNRQLLQMRVNMVNKNWKEWKKIWHEGTPFLFYLGYYLKTDNQYEFEKDLSNPNFIHQIKLTLNERPELKKYVSLTHDSTSNSPSFDLSPDDKKPNGFIMPDINNWPEDFRNKIAALFRDFWGQIPNEDFFRKCSYNEEQCNHIFAQLKDQNLLEKKKQTKDEKRNRDDNRNHFHQKQ
jgi:hypothetical protein